MATININRIRFASDVQLARQNQFVLTDKLTGQSLRMFQAEDVQVETSFLVNGVIAADISNFASATLEIKDPTNLLGSPLISVTQPSLTGTVSQANWDNGSAQHAVFTLTNAQTDIALNGKQTQTLSVFVWATTVSTSLRIPCAAGPLTLMDSGYGDVGAITIVPPGARMKSNVLQIYDPDVNLYYNTKIRTINGVPVLSVEGAGDAP